MARKRRRKSRRNPRKHHRRAHARRRKHARNPRRKHRRVRRSNPRRSHRRRAKRRNPRHRVRGHMARSRRGRRYRVRGHVSNPRRRRRRSHRRNPGIPQWAKVGLAAVLGVGVYALVTDGAFAIAQRLDPSMGTVERNRYILGGVAFIGGVALALTKSPLFGAVIAGAGAIGALGTKASLALGHVLDKPLPGATTTTTKGLGAVYGQDMRAVYGQDMRGIGAYQPMGAYAQLGAYQPMGAVYGQDMRGIGDYVPPAPYMVPTPF